jgi:Mn2+/Fe2+ NRAMP family transporter
MVFYQQSAVVEKRLDHRDYTAARGDTALGAVLTQLVSASVLFVAATAFGAGDAGASLGSVGQISEALIPHLGVTAGRLVFSLGVLGASIVAAIVCSLALAWALSEAAGHRRSAEIQPFCGPFFNGVYAVCVIGGAAFVWAIPNLIWLTVWAQILNALLLPMVVGLLVAWPNRLCRNPTDCAVGISVWSSSLQRLPAYAASPAPSTVFFRRPGAAPGTHQRDRRLTDGFEKISATLTK